MRARTFAERTFAEFFAGAGMFAEGLGAAWRLVFANDVDPGKAAAFALNHDPAVLKRADVAALSADDVPEPILLAHASPPCRDVSLAGPYAGLSGARSGAFFPWWRLMRDLRRQGRGPRIVTLENVAGLIASNGGRDLEVIIRLMAEEGFAVGPLVLDALWWTPQSRPRLVIVAAERALLAQAPGLVGAAPEAFGHPPRLAAAVGRMPAGAREAVVWWRLPPPPPRTVQLADIVERAPAGVAWHDRAYTEALVAMMSPANRAKLDRAVAAGGRMVGCLFRRTRSGEGGKIQRAEVRFDAAGCLRVATGGSSRQVLVIVEDGAIRTRLLAPREAARLMGLDDAFRLPATLNAALTVCGDGIAPPVARHVARHVLDPLADAAVAAPEAAPLPPGGPRLCCA